MKRVVVVGEILVEIMADTIGNGFIETQALTGPFPSGAPAIFADQMAKLGQPVAIISAVGDDDFGRLNVERLKRDGVDTSAVFIDRERPTGSAFVRYREDGSRDFVFNIRHSAAGHLHMTAEVREAVSRADHVHVMGSSLSSPEFVDMNINAVEAVRSRGGTVSFDPNLRKEMLSAPGMREAMARILTMTDLYLPSGDELTLLTRAVAPEEALDELFDTGIKAVVHKQGTAGARYHDRWKTCFAKAYQVEEVDPTGAGDCFGAAFTSFWLQGYAPEDALRFAAASGAIAVTRRGPMEGTSDLAALKSFMARTGKAA